MLTYFIQYFWLPALESNVIFSSVFFQVEWCWIQFCWCAVYNIRFNHLHDHPVVTVCFCVTSTTTNHVRYVSSPFFLNFQNLVSHILADSDWQISIFQKNISEREPIISDDIISRKLKTLHDKLGKDTIWCMYFIIIIIFCNY